METWPSRSSSEPDDPRDYLRRVAQLPDEAIELAEAALRLASLDRPQVSLERYRHHLSLLVRDVAEESRRLPREADTLEARIAALNHVIYARYSYRGDSLHYDDLQNANLMRVIDRRRGLPVSLGILYIHVARAQGWHIAGIHFPAHFMVRLEHQGRRAIVDPFNEGVVREVSELREMLKSSHGEGAELTPAHYAPVGNRDVLMRLQNNLKLRLAQADETARALAVVETMLLFAPGEASLWYDAGAFNAKLGNLRAAIAALETFLERAAHDGTKHQAATLLQQLRARLN
ncbi:MAG TPA: transglutaminase-like domain-containing protein [Alphaproteobacteria bacterium]|nr:transglutaminase-like domain-containing protein [Alphaproteobacteria bacterium]